MDGGEDGCLRERRVEMKLEIGCWLELVINEMIDRGWGMGLEDDLMEGVWVDKVVNLLLVKEMRGERNERGVRNHCLECVGIWF